MTELLGQIGGGIGIMLASAAAAFRLGVRRGSDGTSTSSASPRWHHEDRELIRDLGSELHGLRDHLDGHADAITELRSSIDEMRGFLQGRFSAPPGD